MQNEESNLIITLNKTNYVHWIICAILILLLLTCWYSKKMLFEGLEGDSLYHPLIEAQENMARKLAEDNPSIQQTVNPVPNMIDRLEGTKWYPQDNPRRVDSIMDPMTEEKLYQKINDDINVLFMI